MSSYFDHLSKFIGPVCLWLACVYSQVSVVRGKVIASDGSPLIGVRVSVVTQPLYGFTLTRELGLYVTLAVTY